MTTDRQEIEAYLASKGWQWRERAGELVLDCPFCGKAAHLYMDADRGLWNCKVCGRAGNLYQLRQELGDVLAVTHLQHAAPHAPSAPVCKPTADLPTREQWAKAEAALWSSDADAEAARRHLLDERKLPAEVVREARLGLVSRWGKSWIGVPFVRKSGEIASLKLRSVPPAPKTFARVEGAPSLLYGAENVVGQREPILVEGELDVLAMRTYGVQNVASTSLGARGWATEWSAAFASAETILLCYDQDEEGDAGALAVAEKLGTSRCLRVRLPHKDAGDCLRLGVPAATIRSALSDAEALTGPRVRQIATFAADAMHAADAGMGEATPWFGLTGLLGGIRRGDLHVVTGRTGDGKSTWTTNLAYRRAADGVAVLVFPAEQKPADVYRKVAAAWLNGSWFTATPTSRASAAAALGSLPIYVVAHYGRVQPDDLRDALRFAVTRLFVREAYLDHLHFFWPIRGGDGERTDIGDAIRTIKTWAQELGITIWLVVQPAKTRDRVTIDDLRGSAELQQTPDGVIVVRRCRDSAHDESEIAVEKCRFEGGREGVFRLSFDRGAQSYFEPPPGDANPRPRNEGPVIA